MGARSRISTLFQAYCVPPWLKWGRVNWATKKTYDRLITVTILIKPEILDGEQLNEATVLLQINQALKAHWNNFVTINGKEYCVDFNAVSDNDGIPFLLSENVEKSTSKYPWGGIQVLRHKEGWEYTSKAIAHELGHPLLVDTYWKLTSATHKGTSDTNNKILESAPDALAGLDSFDLMKYYRFYVSLLSELSGDYIVFLKKSFLAKEDIINFLKYVGEE